MSLFPFLGRRVGHRAWVWGVFLGAAWASAGSEALATPHPQIDAEAQPSPAATVGEALLASEPNLSASGASADDVAALRWVIHSDIRPGSARWSAVRGPLDLGLTFERDSVESVSSASGALRERFATPYDTAMLPSLSIGLRRVAPGSGVAPASSLLQRIGQTERLPGRYESKVGLQWKPSESRMTFLREGLGMRLKGNDRMTVRLRHGRVGVYLYRKF